MSRRGKTAVIRILVLILSLAAPLREAVAADNYPTQPVKLIVPYPAGGSNDIVARLLSVKLAEKWKQSVIVENRVGASGIIASEYVAASRPDGTNILIGSNSSTTIAPHFKGQSAFRGLDDLLPLTNVLSIPAVLVVNPSLPVRSVSDLVTYLKSNPGKLNFGSSGAQSGYYLSMEQFQTATGTGMVHIPYGGIAPAELALIANDVQVLLDSSMTAFPFIKDGRMRALGIASPEPWPLSPEIPLLSASIPDFQSLSFIGVFVARSTPKDLADKITADFRDVLNQTDMRQRLIDMGAIASSIALPRDEYVKFLEADSATWERIIRAGAAKQP